MSEMPSGFDAHSPAEMSRKMEQTGFTKATMPLYRSMVLSVMAGVYIALGSIYYLTVTTEAKNGYGAGQFLGGLVFSVGLILVVVAGAELFTGNTLLTITLANRRISWLQLLRNWLIVFVFNFAGSIMIAGIAYGAQHWANAGNLVGAKALAVGVAKASLPFWVAFWRGVLCNLLVCLAVWLCQAGRTATDKVLAILFPISAFVAAGFEHSVANMFFLPYAIFVKSQPAVVAAANLPAEKLTILTWNGFLHNMVPVTLGNILGGAVLVGLVYWFAFIREEAKKRAA